MATRQPTAYPLRMPDDLRERIEAAANASGRSVNQEIVQRLSESFDPGKSLPKTLTDVVNAAAQSNGLTFEDALLRFVVAGMQAEPSRKAAEEALKAERYRGIAARQLLNRTADTTHRIAEDLVTAEATPERRREWQQALAMLTHEIRRLDRPGG